MSEFQSDIKFAGVMLLLTVLFGWLFTVHQLFMFPACICAVGLLSSIGSLLDHMRLQGGVVCALLLIVGSWYVWKTVSLNWHGRSATAYVTDIKTEVAERENGGGKPYLSVTYRYSTPSGQYTGTTEEAYDSKIEIGDSLRVYYDAIDHSNSSVGRGPKTWLTLALWLVFAGYFVKLLIRYLREFSDWLRSRTRQSKFDSVEP